MNWVVRNRVTQLKKQSDQLSVFPRVPPGDKPAREPRESETPTATCPHLPHGANPYHPLDSFKGDLTLERPQARCGPSVYLKLSLKDIP